eukprot:TRINITY_DN5102_c0_g1_i1.p1 TRINITY_DN5102_c0_g1~~TRINITY_DN5102_c0_g1_i1.p1  ORF type:complete len:749 (+),score=156.41 TRINITY_DN5102_c0_g1_i1:232-2247(+)
MTMNTPFYQGFTFFNLTNPEETAQGGKPFFVKMGPYQYLKNKTKLNVEFSPDGNEVSYQMHRTFYFLPDMTPGSEDDIITTINPAYMGVMTQTGGELQLIIGATGPQLNALMQFMLTDFVNYIQTTAAAPMVYDGLLYAIDYAQQNLGQDAAAAKAFVYDQWANATQPCDSSSIWNGLLVSLRLGAGSGISAASAQLLLDPLQPLSLTNMTVDAALTWSESRTVPTQAQLLCAQFALTTPQLVLLQRWLFGTVQDVLVVPELLLQYDVPNISDLAYVQMIDGSVLDKSSVKNLPYFRNYQSKYIDGLRAAPEYGVDMYNAALQPMMTWQQGKALLQRIYDPNGLGDFMNLVAAGAFSTITQEYGINDIAAVQFGGYIAYIAYEYTNHTLENIFARGGGLIIKGTVHSMLWDRVDPLVEFMQPDQAQVCLQKNDTHFAPSTFYTGKFNVSQVAQFISWRGNTTIQGMWASTIDVGGMNSNGQFAPFIQPGQSLLNWNVDTVRIFELKPVGPVSTLGIDLIRYEMANDTFGPNALYYNSIEGFANATAVQQSPVFLGYGDFYGAFKEWWQKVGGVIPDRENDITTVDIEPITGKVMRARQQLQMNIYIGPPQPEFFSVYNKKFPINVMYPVMLVTEASEIDAPHADFFKGQVYFGLRLQVRCVVLSYGLSSCF